MAIVSRAESYRSWLPDGALDQKQVDRACSKLTLAWSEKWLARGKVRPIGPSAPGPAGPAATRRDMNWQSLPEGLALGVAGKATGLLAAAMLDANLGATALTAGDRALVERITAACLEDLRGSLAGFFGLPAGVQWRAAASPPPDIGAWTCTLGLKDNEPLIRLAASPNLLVAFRKSQVPAPAGSVGLRPLAEALRRQPIGLSARLGHCAMKLPDLTALNEGDVLVLDRALDTPLELAIDWQVQSARCVLEQEDERLLLKLSRPFSEMGPARG